ncbi:MAG: hypothetical protein HC915_06220, partial [Anaerolineae bacterium]|nr:hypothetical protein [Anaerolineae bacterium]
PRRLPLIHLHPTRRNPPGYYQQPQAPAYPDQPSGPSSPYAPSGYVEEERGGGITRWVLLGCGCFIVLCVIGAVIALIVIDQTCAWEQEPLATVLDILGLEANQSFQACQ